MTPKIKVEGWVSRIKKVPSADHFANVCNMKAIAITYLINSDLLQNLKRSS